MIQNKVKKLKMYFIMTRLKNLKGHPPSYGKPWNLLVCRKVHLALPKLVCLKEKKLYFKVSNIFNNFFTSVAEKLVNKLPKRPIHFRETIFKRLWPGKRCYRKLFSFFDRQRRRNWKSIEWTHSKQSHWYGQFTCKVFETWCRGHCLSIVSYHKFISTL